jgi:hypothetical protein
MSAHAGMAGWAVAILPAPQRHGACADVAQRPLVEGRDGVGLGLDGKTPP